MYVCLALWLVVDLRTAEKCVNGVAGIAFRFNGRGGGGEEAWSRDCGNQLNVFVGEWPDQSGRARPGRGRAQWEHTWLVKQVRLEAA